MNQEFVFKPEDIEGEATLDAVAKASRFNQWMYDVIHPHCSGKILEIGSGIGNISTYFLRDGHQIMLSDIRENYCAKLQDQFSGQKGLLGVELMNITDEDFDKKFGHYFGTFDTLFALNVVEHIYDHQLALKNCAKLLKKGGKLIVLVPAYQALFNNLDTALEHYRRYNKASLNTLFEKAQYKIVHSQYFNSTGIPAWFISGKLQGNNVIPEGQMGLYDLFVPVFRIMDKLVFNSIGLSVITVGEK
jgi:2-polyprenyl-3-methyl-5-hydroxy-6-metoxy-1,4-benzoquinol methylase